MFQEIKDQFDEYDGATVQKKVNDPNTLITQASNKDQTKTAEYLKAEISSNSKSQINITYSNIDSLTISYYKLNL